MTILPDTYEVHEAIRAWGAEYGAALAEALHVPDDDPAFVAYCDEFEAPTTDRETRLLRWDWTEHITAPPAWPILSMPSWAVEAEVGEVLGGEVVVMLKGASHGQDGATAWATANVTVVVLPEVGRPEPAAPGDHTIGADITITWSGPDAGASWQDVDAFSKALRGVALQVRDLEAAS